MALTASPMEGAEAVAVRPGELGALTGRGSRGRWAPQWVGGELGD